MKQFVMLAALIAALAGATAAQAHNPAPNNPAPIDSTSLEGFEES